MKTIITHISPDLDAITSVWLIVRFMHGWETAELAFVPAGKTYEDKDPDEDPNVIHVDTGLGRFDHHQLEERTSASRRVLDYLLEKDYIRKTNIEALDRIVDVVTMYDNFGEVHLPDPTADIYNFSLNEVIYGLRGMQMNNHATVETVMPLLDALLINMKVKISAEAEMAKGITIQTRWGRSLIVETSNDEVLKFALKSGYTFVARRDPDRNYIRIKTFPSKDFELTELYQKIIAEDKQACWFLHSSKNMLLNGSYKESDSKPSALSLQRLVEIIQST
jgi:hypothetical protein